jgi:hypothetical protein
VVGNEIIGQMGNFGVVMAYLDALSVISAPLDLIFFFSRRLIPDY